MEFKDLQVGDYVYINSNLHGLSRLVKVERITKTLIIANNQRFNIKTGEQTNKDWYNYTYITIPSKEQIKAYFYKDEVNKLKRQIGYKLPYCEDLGKLKKLYEILEE